MRTAVVDIGTNSTRLLIAEVAGGALEELDRRSVVTRLGEGVDATGRLGDEPQERVLRVLDEYAAAIEEHGCERRAAVMTSAVRDAANGAAFAATVRDRYGLDARTLSGDEEARLTFLGATAARSGGDGPPLLVIDIGGGSTELVVGERGQVDFHVSVQAGVVRHTERHLNTDPPTSDELGALAREVRAAYEDAAPREIRQRVGGAVAVGGTATNCAAIDLAREVAASAPDPSFDPARIEGHSLSPARLREISSELAELPLARRREVPGLHPDRAPTIVAGTILLMQAVEVFGLPELEVSERDILWGVALEVTPDF